MKSHYLMLTGNLESVTKLLHLYTQGILQNTVGSCRQGTIPQGSECVTISGSCFQSVSFLRFQFPTMYVLLLRPQLPFLLSRTYHVNGTVAIEAGRQKAIFTFFILPIFA